MNSLVKFSVSSLALAMAMGVSAADFKEGEDYITLESPEQINTGDIVVVREFFWYGCPHCYHLDPHAQKWKKTKAKDVAFFHTPAPFNPVWEGSAKGFYAAQKLGVGHKAHTALFDAIQKDGKKIYDQNSLADFYANYGADKTKFNAAYTSFDVGTKLGRAKTAAQRYKLTGVPAVVVHGKYVVKGSDAKTFKVVDYLVDKVRKDLKK